MAMNQQQWDQKNRDLTEKILERAATDANFRKQLVDNPQQALQSAGLSGEAKELAGAVPTGDVTGHAWTLLTVCLAWTAYQQCIIKQQ